MEGLLFEFCSVCFLFFTWNASRGNAEYENVQLATDIEQMFCARTVVNMSRPNILNLPVIPPQMPVTLCCEGCSNDAKRCFLNDNCCLGAFGQLPSIKESKSRMEMCVQPQLKSPNEDIPNADYSIKVIKKCPQKVNNGTTEDVIARCYNKTRIMEVIPVTDVSTLYTYGNKYCALCNSIPETQLIYWSASVICNMGGIKLENRDTIIKDVRQTDSCNIVYDAPLNYTNAIPKCRSMKDKIVTCNETGHWKKYDSFIERACLAYTNIYYNKYRNVFCYMCNTNDIEAPSDCPYFDRYVPPFKYSFSALISAQADQDDLPVTKSVVQQRKPDQVFDPIKKRMLKVVCKFPKTFSDGICVNMVDTVGGAIFDVYFELTPQEPYETNATVENIISQDLLQRVISNITQMGFKESYITRKTLAINTKANITSTLTSAKVVLFLELTFARKYPVSIVDSILAMDNTSIELLTAHSFPMVFTVRLSHWYDGRFGILDIRSGEVLQTLDNRRTDLQSLYSEFNFNYFPKTYHLNKFSACAYLTLYNITVIRNLTKQDEVLILPHKFELNYGDILIPFFNYALNETELHNVTVHVCSKTFEQHLHINNMTSSKEKDVIFDGKDNGIFIVSFICTLLSMLSALCTFVVYCLFKELRTQPGINNMILALYLLIAQTLFLFGYGSSENVSPVICTVIGVCLHFFWLTFAMWMNVCCIHTFRVFRSTKVRRGGSKFRTVAFYTLYSWLMASIPVIIHIIMNNLATDGTSIGYGGKVCYISPGKSVVFMVTVPIVTIVIVDMVLYCIVVFKIKSALGHFEHQGESRNLIAVYLRLSTITGGTWILAIVFVLTNAVWVEYLFVIFNALQGVFITIAFIVNRRVLKLMTSLCRSMVGTIMSSSKPDVDGDKSGPSNRTLSTNDQGIGMTSSTFVHTQQQAAGETSTNSTLL